MLEGLTKNMGVLIRKTQKKWLNIQQSDFDEIDREK